MLSFWETESFLRYDTIVVGSGIVGVCTAIALKEKYPAGSVLILERSIFPAGASTRNAGFACFGSLTEILSDLRTSGHEKTLLLIEKRIQGLAWLRNRLSDVALDYQPVGGYELLMEKDLPCLSYLDEMNVFLKDLFPQGVFASRKKLIPAFGFNTQVVKDLLYNPYEGHLHSGKLMRALLQLAQEKGIDIRTGAEVTEVEDNPSHVNIYVQDNIRGKFAFQAKQAILCTNAFTNSLLPDLDIRPGRGQVLITKPIPQLPWQGTFHFDEGYYYFRNVGTRILFGGGRNLDFRGETTTRLERNKAILHALERILGEVIVPNQPVEIEQCWSGIMGFSTDKNPVIRRVSPRLIVGFACNGMGVSLASKAGEEIAALVINNG